MNALPTNRDENWRYANLRPFSKAAPAAVVAALPASLDLPAPLLGYERFVFVDGEFAAQFSAQDSRGAAVLDARDAGAVFAEMLDADLGVAGIDFSLARANAAHGRQVLHVTAPADSATVRIEVTFVATQPASAGTSYPRLQVHAGRNAEVCLVERHVSAAAADSVVNAAVDIAVGAGATVNHHRLQNCADPASCFDTLVANVAERGVYRLRTVTLGGLTSRSTVFVKLAGRGASCEFTGASVANLIQTHDIFAEIEHVAPDTRTREVFRGIATDRGKLAFNGKMIVRQSAPGADSDQSLKTLLTGAGSEASVRPQLEIYTDKVRAVHGATTGKLDEQMLFYLLTRGIDRQTAQVLLQWAFIEQAVARIEPAELRREVETLIAAQLREISALDGLLAGA